MFININDKVKVRLYDNTVYDGEVINIVLQPNDTHNSVDSILFIKQEKNSNVEPFGIAAVLCSAISNITILQNNNNGETIQENNNL